MWSLIFFFERGGLITWRCLLFFEPKKKNTHAQCRRIGSPNTRFLNPVGPRRGHSVICVRRSPQRVDSKKKCETNQKGCSTPRLPECTLYRSSNVLFFLTKKYFSSLKKNQFFFITDVANPKMKIRSSFSRRVIFLKLIYFFKNKKTSWAGSKKLEEQRPESPEEEQMSGAPGPAPKRQKDFRF